MANDKNSEMKELHEVLLETKITLPNGTLGVEEDVNTNLLRVFIACQKPLINGITNDINMDDDENYLYFTISPMLKVHGLMENEKVTGAKYRRYVITDKGTKLLAYVEKNKVKRAKEKKEAVAK